jgi:hypothetical protein
MMDKLALRFAGVNWKLAAAVVSILAFAVAGSADDIGPW